MPNNCLHIYQLGRQPYEPIWQAMRDFTDNRTPDTPDQLWLVEHDPVFTQGQAGKPEHLLNANHIPVVKTDRGGQITYHGPGQLVAYPLINLKRRKLGVRDLVTHIEQSLVALLKGYGIEGYAKCDAPGVYVNEQKIASLGLRIRKGCSFHGLALNVDMDLSPFLQINPCGYQGLQMTQTKPLQGPQTVAEAAEQFQTLFAQRLGYPQVQVIDQRHQEPAIVMNGI